MIAAVIDIGSNSVLSLAVTVVEGRARERDAALATTRLGAGLTEGGTLSLAGCSATRAAVRSLAARARDAGAERVWGFATAAARRARDGKEFVHALATESGVPIEILSGEREAHLAYSAVAHGMAARGAAPLLVADLGGGTTELTLGRGGDIVDAVSLPLGALALMESHLGAADGSAGAAARAAVDGVLQMTDLPARARVESAALVASGGTATALAALDLGLEAYSAARVHGHVLTRAMLGAVRERMAAMPAAVRALDSGRAALLPAGALILDRLAAAAGASELRVSEQAVRHAYLRERLAAELGRAPDFRSLWG
jgi:exopolyphosphatase/guanosine-5'-triphosphate,3'-diphosphate pyrophosphatase